MPCFLDYYDGSSTKLGSQMIQDGFQPADDMRDARVANPKDDYGNERTMGKRHNFPEIQVKCENDSLFPAGLCEYLPVG